MYKLFLIIISFLLSTGWACAAPLDIDLKCKNPVSPIDQIYNGKLKPNLHLVAAKYAAYAAASYDAYANNPNNDFQFDIVATSNGFWKELEWNKGKNYTNQPITGLYLKVYYAQIEKCIVVMIAIRGTNGYSIADWSTNITTGLGLRSLFSQYRSIDNVFLRIRQYLNSNFADSEKKIIATGHSLGGGLAEHLALCFTGVDSVSFNASPVTDSLGCNSEATRIRIYEDHEILRSVTSKIGLYSESGTTYDINLVEEKDKEKFKQHSMLGLATGMLRLALDCRVSEGKGCEIRSKIVMTMIKKMYCISFNQTQFEIVDYSVRKKYRTVIKVRSDSEVCN